MRVRILQAALDDIDEILRWVEENHGMGFAASTRKEVFITFETLGRFPRMGRSRPEVTHRPVLFFLLAPYWIVYEPVDPLVIHRVLHGKRDLSRLLSP